MNIREITIRRCREFQCSAEYAAWKAGEAVMRGDLTLAIAYQFRAAADAEAAWSRLARIIGVDAIVELTAP